jgi:hypothetical protein
MDLGRRLWRHVRLQPPLRVYQMTRKQRVDEGRLAQARLAHDHHVELEPALEELVLNLAGDGWGSAISEAGWGRTVEAYVGAGDDFFGHGGRDEGGGHGAGVLAVQSTWKVKVRRSRYADALLKQSPRGCQLGPLSRGPSSRGGCSLNGTPGWKCGKIRGFVGRPIRKQLRLPPPPHQARRQMSA